MATDVSSIPVNGSQAPHQGYDGAQTGYAASNSQASSAQNSASNATSEIPKDEVGWYFVEQYYTTLSRSPEKLYLFYNKRSQFVLGDETDKVAVCVGQKSINERIKDLDFQDCKVRVTNVDSQASDSNIIIQVIGEISNKSQPHKKFVQTFVLAGQTNGYFVLNDIFRYLIDEEEEDAGTQESAVPQSSETQEPVHSTPGEPTTEALSSSEDPVEVEQSAKIVDKVLQEKVSSTDAISPAIPTLNGVSNTSSSRPAPAEESTTPAAPEAGLAPPSASLETEKPKDPNPSPAKTPPKKAAQPVQAPTAAPSATPTATGTSTPAPTKSAAPKTWANLLATSNRVATPAVPSSQPNAAQTPAQSKASATTSSAQAPPQAPATASKEEPSPREPSPSGSGSQQDEWVSVGDSRRQQARGQANTNSQEGPQHRAYIKNVHEGIDGKQLKSILEKFGEIAYFDVSRQKNCAFVDFKTAEGYKAAIEANPHHIGNDRVLVEERRMKPGSYPYVPRGGSMRGGRGSPAQGGNRGSFQGNRGGFPGRGRGGGGGSVRGRGGVQAA